MTNPSLFLLLINLAQIRSRANVVSLFVEGMNSLFPELGISWTDEIKPKEQNHIEVCTRNGTLGAIVLSGGIQPDEVTGMLLQNASQMLAVILEKLDQEQVLREQKTILESLAEERAHTAERLEMRVAERTAALENANSALRESEEKYRLAMEATADGLWDWDVRSGHVYYSPGWGEMLGLDEVEPRYQTWEQRIHPEDRNAVLEGILGHLSGKTPQWRMEHRLLTSEGDWKWVLGRGRVVSRDEDGNPLRMVGTMTDITVRKQTEQELRESRETLNLILDTVPQSIFWKDKDSRYLGCNRVFAETVGLNHPEQILGKTDFDLPWPREEAEAYRADDREVLESNKPKSHIIEPLQKADGTRLIIDTSKVPLPDANGRPFGILGVYEDITERKKGEEDLRESTRRYLELFEGSRDGFVVVDDHGYFVDANASYCKMVGYSVEELKSKGTFHTITPEHWHKWEQEEIWCNRLMRTGNSGVYEKEYIRKDGCILPVEIQSFTVSDDSGNVRYLWGIARDITERKQAEDALRESETKLRLIFDNSRDAIGVSIDGRHIFVNKAYVAMFAYDSCDDILNLRVTDIVAPASRNTITEYVQKRAAGKSAPEHYETMGMRRDGEVFPMDVTVSTYTLSEVIHTLVILRDITERKHAEEEREKLQAQLLQSQKMESVGRLAGGVAHDFNNMLGVILGFTELAMGRVDPSDPVRSDLEEILLAAQRSADLTRQLLAFARKQTIAPKVQDLNETVVSMTKMLQRLIGEDIDLTWHPGANLWPVKIDPTQIDQILANLCANARDAIAGLGKITIETHNRIFDEEYCIDHADCVPGEYVMLAVSDNGCGMDKETLSFLFEPFFTRKEMGKGTGLGLAMVYGVVKQNQGFINVYSEPGEGTTFKIYLPRHAAKPASAPEPNTAKPTPTGNETILLVEDEPAILRMAKLMLEKQGYTVLATNTPGEAIRIAREHIGEINLLMTDVVMPEMNGRDLAKNLLSLYPNLKRLFMSGYTANVIAHHGVLDEGVHFIQKPFQKTDLAAKIRAVLDQS